MVLFKNHRFVNWAGNQECIAKQYIQPHNEAELLDAIKSSVKFRMIGTGHSWSGVCISSETLINLDRMNRVLKVDKDKMQVTVQAGIKLWQLNKELDRHGLALRNLGSIADQSVAGAISTGTHGTGINFQILGSQMESFILITPEGKRMLIDRNRDTELFNLSVVNLGALGVISEVTINVVPAFNLHDNTKLTSYNEVVENLQYYIKQSDHFKFWWFPHTDKVVIYSYNHTNQQVNDSRFRRWLMDEFLSVTIYRVLLKFGNINRNWRMPINRLLLNSFKSPIDRIEKSHKVFNVPKPPLHRETEWAFDLVHAKEILRKYRDMIEQSKHRINFIQEVRFTKGDEFALSPCHKRNAMWLGVYNADNFGWDALLRDFEILATSYNGRPHWGKEFTVGSNYLCNVYPQFNAFNAKRKELDPNAKLVNPFLSSIFNNTIG